MEYCSEIELDVRTPAFGLKVRRAPELSGEDAIRPKPCKVVEVVAESQEEDILCPLNQLLRFLELARPIRVADQLET